MIKGDIKCHSCLAPSLSVLCASFRLCNPPLNPLSQHVRAGIMKGLEQAQSDPAVSCIVITGEGQAFSVGADVKEMVDGTDVLRSPALPAVVDAIEKCSLPVIAAIGGTALGGGCEVRKPSCQLDTIATAVRCREHSIYFPMTRS